MKKLITTALLALASHLALAANLAIIGGNIYTQSDKGVVKGGTLLIRDGRIEAVKGSKVTPAGYKVIDASGKWITPGLMGAMTNLGLVEVEMSAGLVDRSADDNSPYTAALDVSYALNPYSTLIPISRLEGVTRAATAMSSSPSIFEGQGAIIALDEKQFLTKARAFIVVNLSESALSRVGGSRAAAWPLLRQALKEALLAAKSRISKPTVAWHGVLNKTDTLALVPVVKGKMPLILKVDRHADISQAIALKRDFPKLKLALAGAAESWQLADELADAGIAVILDPESNLPFNFSGLGATLQAAAILEKAGVRLAIGINTHNIRLLTQHAGNAIAMGLSWQGALDAVTTNTAAIYGIDDQYGRLAPGYLADVVIWSGDPFEVMTAAEQVIVNGRLMPMESRQTKLRDRYLKLDQKVPYRYIQP